MEKTFTITTTKEVSFVELWEAIWGSDGSGITYWVSKIRQPDGSDIDLWITDAEGRLVGNPQDFKVYDYEEDEWHTCTLAQLAKGYELALNQNLRHCGGCITADLDDADECTGDQIIQMAIFGELIYG